MWKGGVGLVGFERGCRFPSLKTLRSDWEEHPAPSDTAMKRVGAPPVAIAPKPEDRNLKERLADREYYKKYKKQLYQSLCSPGDPPPRLVKPGTGPQNGVCRNVNAGLRAFRACGRECELVRGWKVLVIDFPNTIGHESWRAVPHAVVREVANDVYHCFTAEAAGKQFLFLPSSRVASELSDEAFLSGGRVLKCVVGGNPHYVQIAEESFPEQIGRTPEKACSYETIKTHLPSGVMLWIERTCPGLDGVEVAKELGFPTASVSDPVTPPKNELTERCLSILDTVIKTNGSEEDMMRALDLVLKPIFQNTKRGRCLWELRCEQEVSERG